MASRFDGSFFPVLKRRAAYATKQDGSYYYYTHYRGEIAEDCQGRCVYCDAHEDEVGGRECMELDHFRPFSLAEFAHLGHDPFNLHHACGRCNRLKSNHWPAAGTPHTWVEDFGFIDPFVHKPSEFFEVKEDGELRALKPPAGYLIRLLALNRPYLKVLRRRRILNSERIRFETENVPKWEAARHGTITMKTEELADTVLT